MSTSAHNPHQQGTKVLPIWTHTRNVQSNHEIDHLKVIWDIWNDPDTNFTIGERQNATEECIRKRCATLQIGAVAGWRSVPGSELQESFQQMGLTQAVAAERASATYAQNSSRKPGRRHKKDSKK
jgi:hypothetical protein